MKNTENTKDKKQLAVSIAILEVIECDGLGGVTHSKVSRKSKVSRAWIYEYIGKEKSDLIEYAVDFLGSFFARAKKVERPQSKAELEKRLIEGTEFVFQASELNPVIIKLQFRFRGTATPIGEAVRKYETYWLDSMKKSLIQILKLEPLKAAAFAEMIQTLRLGFAHRIITSSNPRKSIQEARIAFEHLYGNILNET